VTVIAHRTGGQLGSANNGVVREAMEQFANHHQVELPIERPASGKMRGHDFAIGNIARRRCTPIHHQQMFAALDQIGSEGAGIPAYFETVAILFFRKRCQQ